jgi:hypothetical protein
MKTRRFSFVMASVLAAFAVFAPAAFAGPGTYYASPTGNGMTCESAAPCALTEAVKRAANEDAVILEPGTYTLATEVAVTKAIEIGGQPGAAAPVIVTNGNAVRVQGNPARIHDLRIEGSGPFQLFSGVGERIFVSFTGTSNHACGMSDGASLVDSVCWAHDGGPTATASAIELSDAGKTTTMTLRNDTAIDSNTSGEAIRTVTSGVGPKLVVEATGVIARANQFDIETNLGGSDFPVTEVKLTHSNYATVAGEVAPLATITAPGTNGNQTAVPTFVAAAEGDFREAAGSPTIDAGLTEAANGPLAVGGEERTLAACLGGPAVTDIGAYEFVPTAPCGSSTNASTSSPSTTTSTQAPPPPPISNLIKVGKLKLNKKVGTATLTVNTPDAGTLTVTGKGMKKVVRSSKGAATLHLPIGPVGKTKKALAKTGKAKLALTLTFAPTGGKAKPISKTVKLLEK